MSVEDLSATTSIEIGEEDDYQELVLEVSFRCCSWTDQYDYGSQSYCEDDEFVYQLDGVEVTREQLVERVGEERAAAAIENAIEKAH